MESSGASREEARKKHGPTNQERSEVTEIQRLTRVNKSLRNKIGNSDWLIGEIASRVEDMGILPEIEPVSRIYQSDVMYPNPLKGILAVADPHMEEVVDPSETEGLLEWNFPRFKRALWQTAKKCLAITEIMRARHFINELHIFFLGDMVTGEIHPDVYFSNAFYLPDALTYGPYFWAQFVRELSAHFDKVICTCVPGNHGRLDLKPTSKRAVGRNWDTCMYQNIAIQTRDLPNVEWFIPRSPKCVVEVNGWYFLLQHGDRVPQHGGITPYYGMARQRSAETAKRMGLRVRDIEQRVKEGLLFDYDMRGHHHLFGTVEERTLMVPSMMGNNEFGQEKIFASKTPGARMMFVDEQEGLAGDWRINLSELPEGHGFSDLPVLWEA